MSALKVNTIQNFNGVEQYLCKAWVNFNGTGTVAIRAAGNVSSITDNGAGDFTVNFATAMPDANYAYAGAGQFSEDNANGQIPIIGTHRLANMFTASSLRIRVIANDTSANDAIRITVAVFR